MARQIHNVPESHAQAMKQFKKRDFPHIFTLLKMACNFPLASCERERTAGTVRKLNAIILTSMTESRLPPLTLIHIHYDMKWIVKEQWLVSHRSTQKDGVWKCFMKQPGLRTSELWFWFDNFIQEFYPFGMRNSWWSVRLLNCSRQICMFVLTLCLCQWLTAMFDYLCFCTTYY